MKQRGFSMVELLVVIGIATVIAGTVWALVPRANEDAKIATLAADVSSMRTAITANYRESYAGLDAAALAPVLPRSMRRAAAGGGPIIGGAVSPLVTPWGTSYSLTSVTWGGVANAGYEIQAALPRLAGGDCVRLVRQVGEAFQHVSVDGQQVRSSRGASGWMAQAKIEQLCTPTSAVSADVEPASLVLAWSNP